jgi:DNA-directed RNA polymerase subunit M/transcription elongation factor TFIIS
MRFCPECSTIMDFMPSADGIQFKCVCGYSEPGTAEDTLRAEGFLESSESAARYEVMIDNAPFDQAAFRVYKDCPGCGLNYMAQVNIPGDMSYYTCDCGKKISHADYMAADIKKKP